MRGTGSSFEVRCLRCDVSFPLETRRCVHCGGPTSASLSGGKAGAGMSAPRQGPIATTSGTSPTPIGIETAGPFPWSRPREAGAPATPGPSAPGGELPDPDEAPQSPGAMLFRSFGSLIWIVALIGFSIVRSCSEG